MQKRLKKYIPFRIGDEVVVNTIHAVHMIVPYLSNTNFGDITFAPVGTVGRVCNLIPWGKETFIIITDSTNLHWGTVYRGKEQLRKLYTLKEV